MKVAAQIFAVLGFAASVLLMHSYEPTFAQKLRQQPVPVVPQMKGPTGPQHAARTHCNGSCMCSGKDCTDTWKTNNCKDTATCSSSGTAADEICTCQKK